MEPLVIGLMIFATVFVGTLALTRRAPERELVAVRLRQIAQDRSPRNLVLTLPFYRRALVPLVTAAVRVVTRVTPPKSLQAVHTHLAQAGQRHHDPGVRGLLEWLPRPPPRG